MQTEHIKDEKQGLDNKSDVPIEEQMLRRQEAHRAQGQNLKPVGLHQPKKTPGKQQQQFVGKTQGEEVNRQGKQELTGETQ